MVVRQYDNLGTHFCTPDFERTFRIVMTPNLPVDHSTGGRFRGRLNRPDGVILTLYDDFSIPNIRDTHPIAVRDHATTHWLR